MKRILILTLILLLSACTKINDSVDIEELDIEEAEISEETEDEINVSGIKVSKDGAVKELNTPIIIDFFFDPACLSCLIYNDEVSELINDKIESGDVGVIFHPVPFLNDKTPDDYSNRASAYILAVAEYAPDKALTFIQNVLSESFRPEELANENVPDSKFIEAMRDSGLTENEIEKVEFNKDSFVSIAIAAGKEFTSENSKWINFSPIEEDGEKVIFTPFVLVNENGQYQNEALSLEGDLAKELENKINEVKDEIQHKEKQAE